MAYVSPAPTTQARSLAEGVDKELTCAICLSRYNNPKLLPCLHSYCKGCLEDLLKKSHANGDKKTITCPQCQEVHDLPEGGVDGLKTYFTISNLVDLLNMHETSEVTTDAMLCESGLDDQDNPQPAFACCLTCLLNLCKDCHAIHTKQKSTKWHNIVVKQSSQKFELIRSLQKNQYCEEHGNKVVKLFCNTCRIFICRDCALSKHAEHDYATIQELRPKIQETLVQLMSEAQAKKKEFMSHKNYVDDLHKLSKNSLEVSTKQVTDAYEIMVAQLKAHYDTLISELNDIHDAEIKHINSEKRSLSLALEHFEKTFHFTQQLLNNEDDLEVMSLSVPTQEALEVLGKMTWDEKKLKPPLIRVRFDPELTDMKPFGTVLDGLQAEDVTVSNIPETAHATEEVTFKVQVSSEITERGYNATENDFSVTVIINKVPVSVNYSRSVVNTWEVSFVPENEGLCTISIELGPVTKEADIKILANSNTPDLEIINFPLQLDDEVVQQSPNNSSCLIQSQDEERLLSHDAEESESEFLLVPHQMQFHDQPNLPEHDDQFVYLDKLLEELTSL